ncbi:MAG: hypothetical protein H8F28_08815 [Fibrella sp.]|nr:hypothetical protein [Armatimonadota bacterium]
MSRDTFGNLGVALFALFLLMIFIQMERYQQGPTAPALAVALPALYRAMAVMGAMICAILIGLRFSRKPPR